MKLSDQSRTNLFFYDEAAGKMHPYSIRAAIYIASICWH